jgi:hypothetical protein
MFDCIAERILTRKQLFQDVPLRAAVGIPMRAVFACGDARGKGDDPLHREILEDLSNIANPAEPTTRQLQIKGVWRKTMEIVSQRVAAFESRNTAIRTEIYSATLDEARSSAISKMLVHQTGMSAIRKFLRSYSGVTGQALEWQVIWRRISGEVHDSVNATFLSSPGCSSAHMSGSLNHPVPTAKQRPLNQDENLECDGKAIGAFG